MPEHSEMKRSILLFDFLQKAPSSRKYRIFCLPLLASSLLQTLNTGHRHMAHARLLSLVGGRSYADFASTDRGASLLPPPPPHLKAKGGEQEPDACLVW